MLNINCFLTAKPCRKCFDIKNGISPPNCTFNYCFRGHGVMQPWSLIKAIIIVIIFSHLLSLLTVSAEILSWVGRPLAFVLGSSVKRILSETFFYLKLFYKIRIFKTFLILLCAFLFVNMVPNASENFKTLLLPQFLNQCTNVASQSFEIVTFTKILELQIS